MFYPPITSFCSLFANILSSNWFRLTHLPMFYPIKIFSHTVEFSPTDFLLSIPVTMAAIILMVMIVVAEKVLTENRDFIIKHLDADDVIDELIQAQLMGKNAAQRVGLVTMSRVDKNRIICEQLSTAGPRALERFCDIIKKESRQMFIADQMEKSRGCETIQHIIYIYLIHSTGLHSATTYTVSAIANEPAPKKMSSSPIDVSRLKSRYLRQLPTAKTGWPKHKVTEFVRLALIQKEDVTLKDNDLNEVTKLTLQGDVDRILKKKVPLANLREIFHYENKPCPQLIVIMGGPGEY